MKKRILLTGFIFLIIFISFFSAFVLAEEIQTNAIADNTKQAFSEISQTTQEILGPLFGEKEMLTRALMFVLLFMIIYSIVSSVFPKKYIVTLLSSLIITALSILWIPSNFLEAIRTQYGAMGAALLSIIPFIILLIFTAKVKSMLVARATWIFFIIYYFALYIYKLATEEAGFLSAENIPYLAAIIAGIGIFFFIKQIREAIFGGEMQTLEAEGMKIAERSKTLHKVQKEELEKGYNIGG